jgi:hypothetical protein
MDSNGWRPCFALSLAGNARRLRSFSFLRPAFSYLFLAAEGPNEASIATAHPPLIHAAAGDVEELRALLSLSWWLAMRRRISTSSFPSREAWLREDLTCPVLPS